MLPPPTLDTLRARRLPGMAQALSEQMSMPESHALSFAERLGLLVEREMTARRDRRRTTRLRQAQWRLRARLEDIASRPPRGLDTSLLLRLASCHGIHARHNVRITGPTGIGTTWRACAVGPQACREGYTVLSLRVPRLLQELPMAQGAGRDPQRMASLAQTAFLMLDDWGLATLSDAHRRAVLALLDDRHGRCAPMVTSPCPVDHWHAALGDPTLAEASLDRLLHNASKSPLRGDAMRQRHATVKHDGASTYPITPGVAALRWGGSFRLDAVAGFPWIRWQLCTGWGGRNHRTTHSEYSTA